MKRNRLIVPVVICVGVLLLASAFTGSRLSANDGNGQCSLKTLQGSYAANVSGWIGVDSTRQPYAAAGVVVQDGSGGVTGFLTYSIDGVITSGVSLVGTYTVDSASCTGEAVSNIGTFFFAIADNGKQTRIVGTTPGTTVVGESIRQ